MSDYSLLTLLLDIHSLHRPLSSLLHSVYKLYPSTQVCWREQGVPCGARKGWPAAAACNLTASAACLYFRGPIETVASGRKRHLGGAVLSVRTASRVGVVKTP